MMSAGMTPSLRIDLVVIDVVDEQVQRADPLFEAPLDPVPLGRRDDPRDEIEGKDPLGAGAVAVHVERDSHVQERTFGGLLPPQQLAIDHRLDELDQRPGSRPRLEPTSNISSKKAPV